MPRWGWILTSFLVIGIGIFAVVAIGQRFSQTPPPDSVACAADARMCPDGSYVGRIPPRCEFAACPGADTNATSSPTSVTVEAQINKSATALGVGVLPLSVLEDSRCPIGAECIWAGTVRLKARIHSAMGDSDMTLTLGTPVTTEAETITLIEVFPANRAGVRIAPQDYRFVFTIEKRAQ